jgi:hypothetical protein
MPLEGDWQRAGLARSVTLPILTGSWAVLSELRIQKLIRETAHAERLLFSLRDCLYRFLQGSNPIKKSSSLL